MSHTPGPDVSRLRVLAVLPCAVALLGALNAPACAQDKGSIFAGGSVGEDRSAFLGGSIALPGATLGHGPAARAILSGGDYHYDSGGQEIKGDYGAADLALLYQFSGAWGYANIGGGAHYADTDLSPNDPGNQRQGSHWDAMVTADGARNMGDFRATAFGSYVFDVEDYYVRADLTRALGATRLGVEGVVLGDPSYQRRMVGLVVGYAPVSSWEIRLSAGYSDSDTHNGGYAALLFSRAF
jgi:hypothetical protein